jgi:hypothetical protein
MQITIYTYSGNEYRSVHDVRQAIFENERKAFGDPQTAEEWAALGITVREERYDPPARTLEQAKTEKLRVVNSECDSIMQSVVNTYPESEILTFNQQVTEAEKYLASGDTVDCPLLTRLAEARGIELADLVARVMTKHDAFSSISGSIIGQRQAYEDRIDACTSIEEVDNIHVSFIVDN